MKWTSTLFNTPDRPPDDMDDLKTPFPKVENQTNTSTTYFVHTRFLVSLSEMFAHVFTADTTACLSLINETVDMSEMRDRIENCSALCYAALRMPALNLSANSIYKSASKNIIVNTSQKTLLFCYNLVSWRISHQSFSSGLSSAIAISPKSRRELYIPSLEFSVLWRSWTSTTNSSPQYIPLNA